MEEMHGFHTVLEDASHEVGMSRFLKLLAKEMALRVLRGESSGHIRVFFPSSANVLGFLIPSRFDTLQNSKNEQKILIVKNLEKSTKRFLKMQF